MTGCGRSPFTVIIPTLPGVARRHTFPPEFTTLLLECAEMYVRKQLGAPQAVQLLHVR